MSGSEKMPESLPEILPASKIEVDMRKTAIAYNNNRDPEFRKAYHKKYKCLSEENRWD